MIGQAFAREKEDVFIQDTLAEPSPGGLTHYRWNVSLSDAPGRHLGAMTSPPVYGALTEHFGTCGRVWRPKEGQRLSSCAAFCPKKGQRLPQKALASCLLLI
jgi:hypothetical protein